MFGKQLSLPKGVTSAGTLYSAPRSYLQLTKCEDRTDRLANVLN